MIVPLIFYYVVCVAFVSGRSTNSELSVRTSTNIYATAPTTITTSTTTQTNLLTTTSILKPEDEDSSREARGMMMDYDHEDMSDTDDDEPNQSKEESKAIKSDPWAGYYDFLINEGSFKFWAAFQLGTAVLLIYSAFAAVYYAKFNPISSDYDYYDDFFFKRRSNDARSSSTSNNSWFGMDSQTFQRIINAITSNKYS